MLRFIHDVSSLLTSVMPTECLHVLEPPLQTKNSYRLLPDKLGQVVHGKYGASRSEETVSITCMSETFAESTRVLEALV
jgi:hypothetical protein